MSKPPKLKSISRKLNAKPIAKKVKAAALGMTAKAPPPVGGGGEILDRLWTTVLSRRNASPETSHSARLLSRGTAKVAQKFGEEAVECLIEAVANNPDALVAESADVLYHLIVLWVASGVAPAEVWAELTRREAMSGVAEKASRGIGTQKIP